MCVCVCVRALARSVAQLCLTLCDPMDCSLPGSSVHGILQARILEWVAISFSRGSSPPRDQTFISCLAGRRCFTTVLWGKHIKSCHLFQREEKRITKGIWDCKCVRGPQPEWVLNSSRISELGKILRSPAHHLTSKTPPCPVTLLVRNARALPSQPCWDQLCQYFQHLNSKTSSAFLFWKPSPSDRT